jgi:LuxR family maltose regulon positive regulatory protein
LSDGEDTLERLEKANMFLTSLGGEYRWYRYHHLFAFVMTNRLQRFFPEQIPELHLRAAKWFQQNDLILDAIEHALMGKNYSFAVEMAESFSFSLLKEGHISTLMRLLGKFPEDVIRKSSRLMIVRIRMMIAVEKDANIEQYLRIAEECSVATGEYDVLHGEFLLIQASAAARQGDYENAFIFAQDALDNLSEDNHLARSEMHFVLGRIYFKQDDFPKALSELKEASLYGKLSGNLTNAVAALCSAGTIYLQLEDFSEAESAFAEAKKLATAPSGKYLPYASTVLGCLADLYIDQGDLEKAKYFAQETVDLGEQWINGDSQVRGLLALARVAHFEGSSYEAYRYLEKAKQIGATYSLVPDAIQGIVQTDEYLKSSKSTNTGIHQDALLGPLTARELEILGLFAGGLSNQEIADKLFISLGTVKAHSSNIYRKLDVRNRAQAVNSARQLKLL